MLARGDHIRGSSDSLPPLKVAASVPALVKTPRTNSARSQASSVRSAITRNVVDRLIDAGKSYEANKKCMIAEADKENPYRPSISEKSKQLAADNKPIHLRSAEISRMKAERMQRDSEHHQESVSSVKTATNSEQQNRILSLLSWEADRKQRLERRKAEIKRAELQHCLFKPVINSRETRDIPFLLRLEEDNDRRRANMEELKAARDARELELCPLAPLTTFSQEKVRREENSENFRPLVNRWMPAKQPPVVRKSVPITQAFSLDQIFSLAKTN